MCNCKLKKFIIFLIIFSGLYFFARHANDGFALHQIQEEKFQKINSISQLPEYVKIILQQPFFYLGKGAQLYAFKSADGLYVIKFMRLERRRHAAWLLQWPLPHFLKQKLATVEQKRRQKLGKEVCSYGLAWDKLKEACGLVALHLDASLNEPRPLQLYDKSGVLQKVDLSRTCFILQKVAAPFYPTLQKWIAQGQFETVKRAIDQLLSLLAKRCACGLADKDPDLRTNFGFLDNSPVQIDIGRFSIDLSKQKPNASLNELIRVTDPLKRWLHQHAPELADYLTNALHDYEQKGSSTYAF